MPDTVLQILIDVIYGCSKTLGPVVVSAMANGVDWISSLKRYYRASCHTVGCEQEKETYLQKYQQQ